MIVVVYLQLTDGLLFDNLTFFAHGQAILSSGAEV